MPGPRKVVPGQAQRIRASTFNTMIDAAQDWKNRAFGSGGAIPIEQAARHGVIIVRNDSGGDLDVFSIVGVNTLLTAPANGEDHRSYIFSAVTPSAGYEQKFAILQEPIVSGNCGKAMIVGVTPALISRPVGDSSQTAGMLAGQTHLQTGLSGSQILWEDLSVSPTATPHLALVSIPTGGTSTPQTVIVAVVATTDIALTGTISIDGFTAPNGSLVLAPSQTTHGGAAARGVYKVNTSGAWSKWNPFQPLNVIVSAGATLNQTQWFLQAANAYQPVAGVYG